MFTPKILSLASALVQECTALNMHIAFAESCTGGLICGAVTEIAGASALVERGFVTYTNLSKTELVGVPARLIGKHGAVSEEVARAMAEGAMKKARTELAVSCTGIAGPGGGGDEKPVGLVHIAAARIGQTTLHEECRFGDIGRSAVRLRSVESALKLLLQIL